MTPELWILAHPASRDWSVFAKLGMTLPLYRKAFELTEVGDVHTSALPGVRAGVGLELTLW
jgi:hypothetical protein